MDGHNAVFTLTDPRGNVLFKHTTATSKYGICSAECPLAQEVLEGSYTLGCKLGDTQSKTTIDVRRYTLPKFKVDVQADRPYYAPGETVRLTVQSDYFFGKPVADAGVEVEVHALDGVDKVVQKLVGKTDERGTVKLTFTVPQTLVKNEGDTGDARLQFQTSVTDSAGQKQTRTAESIVTTRPVRIEAIPEAGRWSGASQTPSTCWSSAPMVLRCPGQPCRLPEATSTRKRAPTNAARRHSPSRRRTIRSA